MKIVTPQTGDTKKRFGTITGIVPVFLFQEKIQCQIRNIIFTINAHLKTYRLPI